MVRVSSRTIADDLQRLAVRANYLCYPHPPTCSTLKRHALQAFDSYVEEHERISMLWKTTLDEISMQANPYTETWKP